MPPKRAAAAVVRDTRTVAVEAVAAAFASAQESSANRMRAADAIVASAKRDPAAHVEAMTTVVGRMIKQVGAAPAGTALRIAEMLAAAARQLERDDAATCAAMQRALPALAAKDVATRAAACVLFEYLLPRLDKEGASDARLDFYTDAVAALLPRVFDKDAKVRASAARAIAIFQSGQRDDDVTQALLAALAEDGNAEVRESVLNAVTTQSVAAHIEGYGLHLLRATRDPVARVRVAAWKALGSFKWAAVVERLRAYDSSDIVLHAADALGDSVKAVRTAARQTLVERWLLRDCDGDAVRMLQALRRFERFLLSAYDTVCGVLFVAAFVASATRAREAAAAPAAAAEVDAAGAAADEGDDEDEGGGSGDAAARSSASAAPLVSRALFLLPREAAPTLGELLMWRANCLVACVDWAPFGAPVFAEVFDEAKRRTKIDLRAANGGGGAAAAAEAELAVADEAALLPPVGAFASVIGNALADLRRPDDLLRHVAALRVALAGFEIYARTPQLLQASDDARKQLLRQLGHVLITVTEGEPTAHVSAAVRAMRAVAGRRPHEAEQTADSLCRRLLLSLKIFGGARPDEILPPTVRSAFEARAAAMAQLAAARSADAREQLADLQADEQHDLVLLERALSIVFAVLDAAPRAEPVPQFCHDLVTIARALPVPRLHAMAVRALGLLCLKSPLAVHTFVPELQRLAGSAPDCGTAAAALGAVFDLMCDYSLRFFDAQHGRPPPPPAAVAAVKPEESGDDGAAAAAESEAEQRRRLEAAAQREDTARVGGMALLQWALRFLRSPVAALRSVAVFGCCRLLALGRVPREHADLVVARLFLFFHDIAGSGPLPDDGEDEGGAAAATSAIDGGAGNPAALRDAVKCFFSSFAAASPERMKCVAVGGITAIRAALASRPIPAQRARQLIAHVLRLTDAGTLNRVRDIDTRFAQRVRSGHHADAEREVEAAAAAGDDEAAAGASASQATAVAATQQPPAAARRTGADVLHGSESERLRRELCRHSLHEYVFQELCVEMAECEPGHAAQALCLAALDRLVLYVAAIGADAAVLRASRGFALMAAQRLAPHDVAGRARLAELAKQWQAAEADAALRGDHQLHAFEAVRALAERPHADRRAERQAALDTLAAEGYIVVERGADDDNEGDDDGAVAAPAAKAARRTPRATAASAAATGSARASRATASRPTASSAVMSQDEFASVARGAKRARK